MTFDQFLRGITKPIYIYRMARGRIPYSSNPDSPQVKAAQNRLETAQKTIDDLVLERARTLENEKNPVEWIHEDPDFRTKFATLVASYVCGLIDAIPQEIDYELADQCAQMIDRSMGLES